MAQLHIWRNIRLELPDDWELLRFSKSETKGRLSFADRQRFRFELTWRKVPGEPEYGRMVTDYMGKLLSEKKLAWARRAESAGWHGINGGDANGNNTRFGRYFADEGLLVEAVFPWPRRREKALEKRVLGSIRAEREWQGRLRRWRVCGMDLLASAKLPLAEGRIEPASARLIFGIGRRAPGEEFRRLGLVKFWLKQELGDWLKVQTPLTLRNSVQERRELIGGHRQELISGRLGGWLSSAKHYRAAAWICPEDGRLYFASRQARRAGEAPKLACCSGLAL
jgi:hypothetical protein